MQRTRTYSSLSCCTICTSHPVYLQQQHPLALRLRLGYGALLHLSVVLVVRSATRILLYCCALHAGCRASSYGCSVLVFARTSLYHTLIWYSKELLRYLVSLFSLQYCASVPTQCLKSSALCPTLHVMYSIHIDSPASGQAIVGDEYNTGGVLVRCFAKPANNTYHTRTLALVDCSGFLWCLLPMPNLILSYSGSTQDPETELRQAFGTIVYRCIYIYIYTRSPFGVGLWWKRLGVMQEIKETDDAMGTARAEEKEWSNVNNEGWREHVGCLFVAD